MIQSTKRPNAKPRLRMAIYTRKSTDENLDAEMNSLEVQRETAEAYIASQKAEGWVCLPQRYDDGGYSGGNTDRPAFLRLMEDIKKGRVDGVVVYKLDRLSRSILDFAKMMEVFDAHKVALVSVTQSFNTSTSLGRLIIHILLSFAQFEREQITERIRDKMAACRKRGKWVGGTVPMGYKVAPGGGRLVVDEEEAERVRAIFEMYLEHGSLMRVVEELFCREWTTPCHHQRRKDGETDEAGKAESTDTAPVEAPADNAPAVSLPAKPKRKPFDRAAIHRILTNRTYIGQVLYKGEIYPGEQAPIVSDDVWEKVQALMAGNSRNRGREPVNKSGALLRGLLHCKVCGRAMSHVWSTKRKGMKQYRYYVCGGAAMNGWKSCPSKSLPAGEIEDHVLSQIERLGNDPDYTDRVARLALEEWASERKRLERDAEAARSDLRRAAGDVRKAAERKDVAELAEAQDREQRAKARLASATGDIQLMAEQSVGADLMGSLFVQFRDVWGELTVFERERVVRLLVSKVTYDGAKGVVGITYRHNGLPALDALIASATAEAATS